MVENKLIMDNLTEYMDFIVKVYDVVRIIDPIKNKVSAFKDNEFKPLPSKCYDIWKRASICDECISRNALEENQPFAKIEYVGNNLYMILAVPIQVKEETVILELLRDITKERILFDSIDNSRKQAYSLLKNRNINIVKDSLTNIYNNRYINERLPYDILKSHINKESLSIFMIDIDNFKEINKKYGHDCGNILLKEFARLIEEHAKVTKGWAARYTADTFMAIIAGYSFDQAKLWAENLRKDIEAFKFHCGKGTDIFITTSLGIYTSKRAEETMEDFMARAKLCLGRAKEQGKNCICSN